MDRSKRKPNRKMRPTLIHVDPAEWSRFQELCGSRGVSKRVRELVTQVVNEEYDRVSGCPVMADAERGA